jgi:hypothetical protein
MSTTPRPEPGSLLIIQWVEEGGPVAVEVACGCVMVYRGYVRRQAPPLRVSDILVVHDASMGSVAARSSIRARAEEAMYLLSGGRRWRKPATRTRRPPLDTALAGADDRGRGVRMEGVDDGAEEYFISLIEELLLIVGEVPTATLLRRIETTLPPNDEESWNEIRELIETARTNWQQTCDTYGPKEPDNLAGVTEELCDRAKLTAIDELLAALRGRKAA